MPELKTALEIAQTRPLTYKPKTVELETYRLYLHADGTWIFNTSIPKPYAPMAFYIEEIFAEAEKLGIKLDITKLRGIPVITLGGPKDHSNATTKENPPTN